MKRLFSDSDEQTKKDSVEILRYVVSILYLARKLSSDQGMLDKIATGIENAERQAQHFSITHDNVYANIASLYQDTVSTLATAYPGERLQWLPAAASGG